MQKTNKAVLLFYFFPYSLKKKISRYLSPTERAKLNQSMSQITKSDIKSLMPVMKEFSRYMKIASEKRAVRSKAKTSEGFEIFFLLLLFLFAGTFFLYMINDFVKKMILSDFFYIIITPLIFLYICIEYNVDVFKRWYSSEKLLNSIILGFLFAVITSFVMIIDNLLFVEEIVELRGAVFVVNLAARVLFGPVIEEIIYRGVIIDFLNRRVRRTISVPVSAIIFSLAHIPINFVDFLLIFVAGLCFGILYAMEKNLISCTIAHSISNIAVFIFIR